MSRGKLQLKIEYNTQDEHARANSKVYIFIYPYVMIIIIRTLFFKFIIIE